jgi:hypothetical protein
MKRALAIVLGLGCAAVLLNAVWPHATVTSSGPDTAEDRPVYDNPVAHGFPVGTTNIMRASASVGLGGRARLLRFNAPLSNILAHVEAKLQPTGRDIPPLGEVQEERPQLKPYGLHELDWFDVENISTGLVVQGVEYNSMIYVDADRELYYYMRTD